MKINEIDGQDEIWAKIKGIELDIDAEFKKISGIFTILYGTKSLFRRQTWLPTIEYAEQNLQNIIDATFSDDESTRLLKEKAATILNKIQDMKSRL
jgi:hypothetical protein